jgi:hypothetical protein
MRPSGAICQPADCCFSELSLYKSNSVSCSRTKRTSSSSHILPPLFSLSDYDWYYHFQCGNLYTKVYYLPFFCIRLWLILPFSMQNFLHKGILPLLLPVSCYSLYHHFQCRSWCKTLSVTSRRQTSFQTCSTHNFRWMFQSCHQARIATHYLE